MVKKVFSTHDVARLCNAHHTTVINWIEEDKLKAYATPGGHRRINKEDILEFMSKYNIPIPQQLKETRKRVLIVDDDPEAIEEFKEALGDNGLQLEVACDGFEAGRKIYKKKPDLILLDFRMPGMDGFEVCKLLHEDEDTTHIPIIAVTVLTSEEDKQKIKSCGVKEYITKPVDVAHLLELVKKQLEG